MVVLVFTRIVMQIRLIGAVCANASMPKRSTHGQADFSPDFKEYHWGGKSRRKGRAIMIYKCL